ncbi:glycoside hydrolase family 32 protein [Cohnella sp.]|uniref:glycoside hydrolase family 32 protein n=1 Tax=Cohnella sp. TaxID=1883426 RepID=UPI0035691FAA
MKHQERIALANGALGGESHAVKNERYRLRYHLMPAVGWMNDPNGLIYFKGKYHVFYQHYPFAPKQGPMYWGHAVSADLVNWEHLPVALAPSEPYDYVTDGIGGGCWSGSAVDDNGTLTLIYTGHVDGRKPEEVQCLATSADGIVFEKAAFNPVIEGPPEEGGFGFRDPKVWRRDGRWHMVVGYGKDGNGKALYYRSDDLRVWTFIGAAAEGDGAMGNMWECPDLFPLGGEDRHVLIVSPMNMGDTKTLYLSGSFDYESGKLDVRYRERLDYGFDFYAPQTLLDERGRRILIGWMNIWGSDMPEREDGWMGAMTLPRELRLTEDGLLVMEPVEELQALRGKHISFGAHVVAEGVGLSHLGIHGDALELIMAFDAGASSARAFGVRVRCSADGGEYTEIRYDREKGNVSVDRDRSGANVKGVAEMELWPDADGIVMLRLFVDRTSVELFAGNRAMSNRIYPRPDSLGVEWFAEGGDAVLRSLDAWEMRQEGPE